MFSAGVLSMKLWGCQLRSIGEADWVAKACCETPILLFGG
jgi:hypothetical protein